VPGRPGKDGLCILHADPKLAVEMGRKSGFARRSRDSSEQTQPELAPPQTAREVRAALGQFISDVRARRLDPKVASTLGYLANVMLGLSRLPTLRSGWSAWRTFLR
jgi:hypothetical protein